MTTLQAQRDRPPRTAPRRSRRDARGLGLTVPALLLLLGAFVGPLLILIAYSLGLLGDVAAGVSLYATILGDAFYRGVLYSTLKLGFAVTAITLVLGYPLAWSLARASGRARTLMTAMVVAPLLTNIVVRTLGWLLILGDRGPVNSALGMLFGGFSYRFLGSTTGVLIALVHVFLPFMVLSMVGTLERIPPNTREAAATHGAHPLVTFVRVTLPLSMSGIVAGSTLVFLLSTGALVTPLILGQGRVWVLTTLIFQQVQTVQWGRAGALAMTLFVVALAIIVAAQLFSQRVGGQRARGVRGPVRRAVSGAAADLSALLRPLPTFERAGRTVARVYRVAIFGFLFVPLVMVIKTAFDSSRIAHSGFESFTLEWFAQVLSDDRYISALLLSLRLAALSVTVGLLIAIPAAYGIVRGRFPGRNAVLALLLSPLTVPHMVLAVGFILFFQILGARPSFTRLLVVHLVITLPYIVRVLVTAFESLDATLEEAAQTLGARRLTTFRRVVFPLLKPAMFAAALFGFLISLDEVTVTVLVAGSQDVTLPVRMFSQLTQQWTPAISALSVILVAISITALFVIERFVGLSSFQIGDER